VEKAITIRKVALRYSGNLNNFIMLLPNRQLNWCAHKNEAAEYHISDAECESLFAPYP
jgi:hypothetical protein